MLLAGPLLVFTLPPNPALVRTGLTARRTALRYASPPRLQRCRAGFAGDPGDGGGVVWVEGVEHAGLGVQVRGGGIHYKSKPSCMPFSGGVELVGAIH